MKKNPEMVGMLIFSAVLMICGSAAAYNVVDLQKLTSTNACEKCDLTMADLSGFVLTGAKLHQTNLTAAKLILARLDNADLSLTNLGGAQLNNADLTGANLTGANLTGANLSEATWTDGSKCKVGSFGQCIK